jgi:putative endonuclease
MSRQVGQTIEAQTEAYLCQQGLQPVKRNYQCKVGEIDLIMRDKDTIVFVEVRYRRSANYGDGLESITPSKIRKLHRAAEHYLVRQQLVDKIPCRFDVVAVSRPANEYKFNWINNAI